MKRKTKNPISDRMIKDEWPKFVDKLSGRLAKGKIEYGDKSFSKEPLELVREIQQECLDITGWGFVLYCRLSAIEAALTDVMKQTLHDNA